jgi:hypothetical protein
MSKFMRKWFVIVALALMPAVLISNVCATSYDLAKSATAAMVVVDNAASPCENGVCPHANLCDLAQLMFVAHSLPVLRAESHSDRIADAPKISIPAEPEPPLKPPVV